MNKTFHGARVLVEKMDEKQYLFKVLSCILGDERGFPGSSPGKGSACNAGDPGSIPESGRTAGEGVGYPLQYSWASLVAQLVKNPPAIWETWVQFLGWKNPLEEGMATHSSIFVWRIPLDRGAWGAMVQGVVKSWTQLSD